MKGTQTLCAALALLFAITTLSAQEKDALKFYGDLRLRFEKDYSVTGKADRDRTRYRFRFGLVHKRGDNIEVGARIRTGNPTDQQSPHQNFGGDFGTKPLNFDKIYFKYKFESGWFWIGKNSFPFWKQNEMFWDDDVAPEGVSASYSAKDFAGEGSKLTLTGGQYIIDHFNEGLFESTISAAQVSLNKKSDAVAVTGAAGIYLFNNEAGDSVSYNALNGMDLKIFVASAQVKFNLSTDVPMTLGADYMKNFEDPTMSGFEDETNGFVAQVSVQPGKWLLAAYYAHIEKFAVVANFAQDDWWRFGSGHTDSSDLEGYELRLGYQLGNKMNLVARYYVTDMIKSDKKANRFRLDLNVKY